MRTAATVIIAANVCSRKCICLDELEWYHGIYYRLFAVIAKRRFYCVFAFMKFEGANNMQNCVEICWHGRRPGRKTAALLLADVAFKTGKYVQGFLNTALKEWARLLLLITE